MAHLVSYALRTCSLTLALTVLFPGTALPQASPHAASTSATTASTSPVAYV
jgi:hypothetical protein